jgi:general secretion pathway protein D
MSLTGLFTDGEVKMIMRGLSQKKGTDLMTAPSVTARSGQKATIEIIREFIYPTEYEPPELPNQVGSGTISGGGGLDGGIGGGIVPPSRSLRPLPPRSKPAIPASLSKSNPPSVRTIS